MNVGDESVHVPIDPSTRGVGRASEMALALEGQLVVSPIGIVFPSTDSCLTITARVRGLGFVGTLLLQSSKGNQLSSDHIIKKFREITEGHEIKELVVAGDSDWQQGLFLDKKANFGEHVQSIVDQYGEERALEILSEDHFAMIGVILGSYLGAGSCHCYTKCSGSRDIRVRAENDGPVTFETSEPTTESWLAHPLDDCEEKSGINLSELHLQEHLGDEEGLYLLTIIGENRKP